MSFFMGTSVKVVFFIVARREETVSKFSENGLFRRQSKDSGAKACEKQALCVKSAFCLLTGCEQAEIDRHSMHQDAEHTSNTER